MSWRTVVRALWLFAWLSALVWLPACGTPLVLRGRLPESAAIELADAAMRRAGWDLGDFTKTARQEGADWVVSYVPRHQLLPRVCVVRVSRVTGDAWVHVQD